jgi:hypothetical protein
VAWLEIVDVTDARRALPESGVSGTPRPWQAPG